MVARTSILGCIVVSGGATVGRASSPMIHSRAVLLGFSSRWRAILQRPMACGSSRIVGFAVNQTKCSRSGGSMVAKHNNGASLHSDTGNTGSSGSKYFCRTEASRGCTCTFTFTPQTHQKALTSPRELRLVNHGRLGAAAVDAHPALGRLPRENERREPRAAHWDRFIYRRLADVARDLVPLVAGGELRAVARRALLAPLPCEQRDEGDDGYDMRVVYHYGDERGTVRDDAAKCRPWRITASRAAPTGSSTRARRR